MRKQLSIVLVEGDHVPRELSALLVGMGVWVKGTWSTGLAAALEQTTPHLVVCGDPSQLPLLKRTINETHPGTPLLLIGDWDLGRAGRAVAGGLVEDLIPDSLPVADIARRLETLAARRATRSPSRATLTPPTRAGIHPLLPVGVGRDDRTPESRQDHQVPSQRPPPPPVRVMSHGPAHGDVSTPGGTSTRGSTPPPRLSTIPPQGLPPSSFRTTSSVHPTGAHPASAHPASAHPGSLPPGSIPPGPRLPSDLPGIGIGFGMNRAPTQPPPFHPRSAPPLPLRAFEQPAPTYQRTSTPAYRDMLGRSPSTPPPRSVPPYSISPDSAPPIQMVTTTTARAARRRKSGPGFTLGAALGVAASAAAFVGVMEFESDLRALTAQSAGIVAHLVHQSGAKAPAWLTRALGSGPKSGAPQAPGASSPTAAVAGAPGAATSGTGHGSAVPSTAVPSIAVPSIAVPSIAAASSGPLDLADLGAIETDSLGLSQADADLLFKVTDARLASCEELLAGWQPPLPMIEEDRPRHATIHRRQAQELLVAGQPKTALSDLCKSARIDPGGPGTETLASVYLSLRSLEQAETWIQRFLTDHPRSDSGRELLGDIENQRGHVARARAVWLDVLGVESDQAGLMREVAKHWVQDATSALGARDLAQAERKLRRALTLDPNHSGAALMLARLLERQGETAASTAWVKRSSEL